MDGLKGLKSGVTDIAQLTSAGPPKGARYTVADQVQADKVELSPGARRAQEISRKMGDLISGQSSEEYRPMKMSDMLRVIRGQ